MKSFFITTFHLSTFQSFHLNDKIFVQPADQVLSLLLNFHEEPSASETVGTIELLIVRLSPLVMLIFVLLEELSIDAMSES